MPAPIITIMDDLVSAAPSTLMFSVTAMSKRRWMIETDADLLRNWNASIRPIGR